jgi:hypothetical protein
LILNKNTKSEQKKKPKKEKEKEKKKRKKGKKKKKNSLTNMGQAHMRPGAWGVRGAGRNAPLTGGK